MSVCRVKTGVLLLVLAGATVGCSRQAEEPAADVPAVQRVQNLLLICIDTVRADTFFRLGELRPDRLSGWQEDALVFTNAAAPAPWTVPSVASAFTGLWPNQHGAGLVPGLKQISMALNPPSVLLPDVRTIAQEAGENGFTTTVVSASQWTFDDENPVDISRGFDDFHEWVPDLKTLDHVFYEPMLEVWEGLVAGRAPDERSLNFVHFLEAHNWHTVVPPKLDKAIAGFTPEQLALYRETAPPRACEDEQSIYCRRYLVYAHAVAVLRDVIADMLDTLVERGQLENTAVVLFSDHGEEFNDHRGDGREYFLVKDNLFFGHGISLYQEQLHVPIIAWHPGLPGAEVDVPVSLIDIAPSAAGWLGLDFAPQGEETWLLHEAAARSDDGGERVLFASHVTESEKQASARVGADKAIWYMASDRIDYYNLDKDPDELQPGSRDDLVLAFDGHFLAYEEMKPARQSESAAFTDEQVKRLQSIGYLQGSESEDVEGEKAQEPPPGVEPAKPTQGK